MALKWGIVCSVPSETNIEELSEFGQWFTECTELSAQRFNLNQRFEENPEFRFSCEPNSERDVRDIYRRIYLEYPNVLFVLHILPRQNSKEFLLMKELSTSYAIIGQGVLLEKALSRFEGLDLDDVFSNVNQYISRRLAQIVAAQREENVYHIHVGETDFEHIKEHDRRIDLTDSVRQVLHEGKNLTVVLNVFECQNTNESINSSSDSSVLISGFPSTYNQYDVVKLFGRTFYRFNSVKMIDTSLAMVEFVNKFHAAQATLEFNGHAIDENNVLSLSPSDDVRQQIDGNLIQ